MGAEDAGDWLIWLVKEQHPTSEDCKQAEKDGVTLLQWLLKELYSNLIQLRWVAQVSVNSLVVEDLVSVRGWELKMRTQFHAISAQLPFPKLGTRLPRDRYKLELLIPSQTQEA
jgi:hypothetical protein